MDYALVVLIQVAYAIASLALISVGLAIIFGMMRVINFAHGEFLMLGGFATIIAVHQGANLWVAMFAVAPLTVGLFGIVVERLIIRPLYGRMIETVLATWGLSLLMIGVASVAIGYYREGVATPLGSFAIGIYRESGYTLFIIAVSALVLLAVFALLRFTRFGLIARATMQNPGMAASLGVNTRRVYALTFFVGSALSGLAGGLIAPLTSIVPNVGTAYIAKAFITVIGGGAVALAGTLSASALFGTVSQIVAFLATPIIGEVALLIAAIALLRLLPEGITGRYFRRSL
ncbi:MAG: branched-chain amino acid ABC transporter permease [Alphaproteobacteria bacterium]|nr:branched-chain amino acid ABC transporter permease [Alphaproteobacteria bacterium]